MSDYFHEQMVNKMLEPKERDFPCKECFIFKIEEERVNQFVANYKEQRMFLRNAEIVKALEDVRAEIDTEYKKFRNKSDKWDERANGIGTALEIIDQKIKEIEHE